MFRTIGVIIVLSILFIQTRTILLNRSPESTISQTKPSHLKDDDTVDWSRFAYSQYATNTAYLCNSVMIFETLHRLQSKADRFLMYPSSFSVNPLENGTQSRLLRKARDEYNVKLIPVQVQTGNGGDKTWSESFTKLLAFNQTQYDRVLSLDSDITILQHMDELFLLPPCPVAIPRAYWLNPNQRVMTSYFMLIQPSQLEFDRILTAIKSSDTSDYDMEIVNSIYKDNALILPHRPYTLLTGEFRGNDHARYLGNSQEVWDPETVLIQAKTVHFSDWPVPKPWVDFPSQAMDDNKPSCHMNLTSGQLDDCRDRDYWLGIYVDFHKRRKGVCGVI